ncbi:hypothetical protein JVU11DRAFT_1393 [Chiua virens]|nr:hypothetical protein JVU11DRAFT_1393 [Chiua virens]
MFVRLVVHCCTMSDEEDYLSDKFLVETTASSSQSKTYTQRRQESLKQSRTKNEQNRLKSRRHRELESREEGLSTSLFQHAKEDSEGGQNKALGIMLKMGFQIGQSLGQSSHSSTVDKDVSPGAGQEDDGSSEPTGQRHVSSDQSTHRAEPLPLNEWSGKRGIGLGKRPRSPGASERLAKMAKIAEEASKETFRDAARREYEERRAEGRLTSAQRTCATLDEVAGVPFNVFWINPNEVESIPKGLMDALLEYTQGVPLGGGSEATRLYNQMRADALQPVASDEDDALSMSDQDGRHKATQQADFLAETVEEAVYFVRLGSRERLSLVLTYLRETHAYCFWCGTKYDNDSDLEKNCPGSNEEDHD